MDNHPQPSTKIAFFMRCFVGGGAERMAVNLANAFARLGYSVDMVLADWSGEFRKSLDPEIRPFDLGCKRTTG